MTPFALFVAIFACFAAVYAAALPNTTVTDTVDLEKRIDHYGKITYYEAGLGACGFTDNGSNTSKGRAVVAISGKRSNYKGNCNQWMLITAPNGKKVYAQTRDMCPSCGTEDLDLSEKAFAALYSNYVQLGVVRNVKWHFMPKGWKP